MMAPASGAFAEPLAAGVADAEADADAEAAGSVKAFFGPRRTRVKSATSTANQDTNRFGQLGRFAPSGAWPEGGMGWVARRGFGRFSASTNSLARGFSRGRSTQMESRL